MFSLFTIFVQNTWLIAWRRPLNLLFGQISCVIVTNYSKFHYSLDVSSIIGCTIAQRDISNISKTKDWIKAHVFKEFLSNVYIRSKEGELFRASLEASREHRLIAAEQTTS